MRGALKTPERISRGKPNQHEDMRSEREHSSHLALIARDYADTLMNQRRPTAPHRDAPPGGVALLIIDMINCFDFDGGENLRQKASQIADPIQALQSQIEAACYPIVYVNDNFGEWHSEKSKLVERAKQSNGDTISKISPTDEHYFVIKPQFSGFYATNLQVLLPKLGVSRLILTGIATDICVLFTAADAHMRDYALWIPEDCVAAQEDQRSGWALEIMRDSMGAETRAASELTLPAWINQLENDANPQLRGKPN